MSNLVFLFDLDSTITRQEILPTVSKTFGAYKEMEMLTEKTMNGELPFKQSFLQRVELLKDIPVEEINSLIGNIELNEELVSFINEYNNRCYVVTGNLDVWIKKLIDRIGITDNLFCSKAITLDGYVDKVLSVLDKHSVVNQIVLPFVAVGDGNNDAEMIDAAEIGIGFGGVREIAPSVLECCTHAVYDEKSLVRLLRKLV